MKIFDAFGLGKKAEEDREAALNLPGGTKPGKPELARSLRTLPVEDQQPRHEKLKIGVIDVVPVTVQPEQTIKPEKLSARMSNYLAVVRVSGQIESNLQQLADQLEQSKRVWASLQPHIDGMELEARRADHLETEQFGLIEEMDKLKRAFERVQKERAQFAADTQAANTRISELQVDLDEARAEHGAAIENAARISGERDRIAAEFSRLQIEHSHLTDQAERDTTQREASDRARIDLGTKLAKLQQTETQSRNKLIELALQNEKLMAQMPKIVAENENLQNQLAAAGRERSALIMRIANIEDGSNLKDREIEELQAQAASTGFAARAELDIASAARRAAERAHGEADQRFKDMQEQAAAIEGMRKESEAELRKTTRELEAARKELAGSMSTLAELNLKYMADLISNEQLREQNKQLQINVDQLSAENQRALKYEALFRSAEVRLASMPNPERAGAVDPSTVTEFRPANDPDIGGQKSRA